MNLLKVCGPQILLCLFTFRHTASKQLNSLTTIATLSWLAGAVVTHPLWVQEVSGSIPDSGKGFYVLSFVLLLLSFYFLPQNTLFVKHFAIPFAMLIYLVYLTYCKICGRLQGYKDTDLASLILVTISWILPRKYLHNMIYNIRQQMDRTCIKM